MLQRKVLYLLTTIIISLISCSSGTGTIDNAAAREAITRSVKLYSSSNWEVRRTAINRVVAYSGTSYSRNVILLLLKATDDPYPLIRVEAVNALARIKTESAHIRIREMALYDREAVVRWTAFKALEVYASVDDESAFITGYGEKDWLIRESAIRGLLKIEDDSVQARNINLIISAMKDSSIAVRIETFRNVRVRDAGLYREISALINNKKTGISLLKAVLTAVTGYRIDENTRKRIVKLLTHENRNVRILALRALKKDEELRKR